MNGVIGDERVGSKIEVLEIVKPGEDADEELEELGLGRMGARALGEGDGLQALNEAKMLGVFAEENQASMVSGDIEGWQRGRAEVMGGVGWPGQQPTVGLTGVRGGAVDGGMGRQEDWRNVRS
jgi:hypothetical protein